MQMQIPLSSETHFIDVQFSIHPVLRSAPGWREHRGGSLEDGQVVRSEYLVMMMMAHDVNHTSVKHDHTVMDGKPLVAVWFMMATNGTINVKKCFKGKRRNGKEDSRRLRKCGRGWEEIRMMRWKWKTELWQILVEITAQKEMVGCTKAKWAALADIFASYTSYTSGSQERWLWSSCLH